MALYGLGMSTVWTSLCPNFGFGWPLRDVGLMTIDQLSNPFTRHLQFAICQCTQAWTVQAVDPQATMHRLITPVLFLR